MNNGTSLAYDGFNLQTDSIITNDIDHYSGPTKNDVAYGIAHANYSAIPFVNYPGKQIIIKGTLNANSIIDMDNLIDTFKGYFTSKDKYLDIGHGGGIRRYVCTPETPIVTRPGGLTNVTFILTFNCTLPFGRNTIPTVAVDATGRTLGIYADGHNFLGNAPYQYVVATFTYTAVSGGTAKTVSFGNNANGQQISVTRDWASGDVLQISTDPLNRFVTINGSTYDFAGGWPEFQPSGQAMGYSDNLTTRTFNENVVYYPMWL